MTKYSLPLCLCLIFGWTAAHAQRVALVIGNAAYQNEKPLNNPINDAELIAEVLRKDLQFDDVKLSKNLSRRDLNRQIAEFAQKAKGADAAFIYYSGHGMQRGGQNYLIPVDASIRDEADIDSEGVASAKLLAELENAAPKITVVVLDACRDNPYSTRTKSATKGLARMGDVGDGMLVAYATREGMTADDGSGRNSPYARALAQQLRNKQQPIRLTFEQVAEDVRTSTGNKQKPVTYGDLKSSARLLPFFSNGAPVQSPAQLQSIEDEAWAEAKQANTVEALESYLEQYPSGRYAKLAQVKLKTLRGGAAATSTVASSGGNSAQPGSVLRDCNDGSCPEMVWLPKGSFMMGSNDGESDERPVHPVSINYDLAVGKYPVTFEQWDACEAAGGCSYRPDDQGWGRGNRPVINVSWEDTQQYINWLSKKTGKRYRLLSEAEWEYAARAGTSTPYYWGDYVGRNQANCAGCGSQWDGAQTSLVGSFAANSWDLYDMSGNVWNWVEDCWIGRYVSAPSNGSAWKNATCGQRVLRGGSWYDRPQYARVAFRLGSDPSNRLRNNGFRVARTND